MTKEPATTVLLNPNQGPNGRLKTPAYVACNGFIPSTTKPTRCAKWSVSGSRNENAIAVNNPRPLLHLTEKSRTHSDNAITLPLGTRPITIPIVKPAASCSGALLARSVRKNLRNKLTGWANIRNPFRLAERGKHHQQHIRARSGLRRLSTRSAISGHFCCHSPQTRR